MVRKELVAVKRMKKSMLILSVSFFARLSISITTIIHSDVILHTK